MLMSNQEQLAALRNEVDDENDRTTRNFQKIQRLQEQLGLLRVKMHDLEYHKRMEREKNDNSQDINAQVGALQQHLERLNDQRQRVIKEIEYVEHKIQLKKNEIKRFNNRMQQLIDRMKLLGNDLEHSENEAKQAETNLKEIREQLQQMNQLLHDSERKLRELNETMMKSTEKNFQRFSPTKSKNFETYTTQRRDDDSVRSFEIKNQRRGTDFSRNFVHPMNQRRDTSYDKSRTTIYASANYDQSNKFN